MRPFKLYPLLCNYYITTRCNARCAFCDIYQKKGQHANPVEVYQNLTDLKKIGVRFIDFTGGEPLLHPRLPEFLIKAKQLGFQTTVTTNCILYPRIAEQMKDLVDLLHFSLDSPVPEEHDAIRGVKCFDKVMESLEIAVSLNETPDILFTVTNENIHHLSSMAAFAQQRCLILLINPVFSYFDNEAVTQKTLNKILTFTTEPYVYINRGIVRFMKRGGNQTAHPRCRAVTTALVISPDNHLLLPCYHKTVHRIPIQNQLYGIFQSGRLRTFQKKEGRYSFCENCTISCYFDPSFTYGIDDYFLLSQISKVKYAWDKYVRRSVAHSIHS
jgi:MoaA/NifB/PqqE/SkfB family radical SAM enzyme